MGSVSDPYSFFSGSGSSVGGWRPIRIRIQSGSRALMTKNWKKITAEKKIKIFLNLKLQFTYPQASIKYVQVTEEAFSSQKRPSNTSKHELLQIFFYFCGSFLPSWIRIHWPDWYGSNPDPDPKPCAWVLLLGLVYGTHYPQVTGHTYFWQFCYSMGEVPI